MRVLCYDAVTLVLQAQRGEFGEEERKGQKEITLREDISEENRALLYKDYLMTSMTSEFTLGTHTHTYTHAHGHVPYPCQLDKKDEGKERSV